MGCLIILKHLPLPPQVLAATIEFGLTFFEIDPRSRDLKDAEPSLQLLTSFFTNKTFMFEILSEMLSTNNQTVPYEISP